MKFIRLAFVCAVLESSPASVSCPGRDSTKLEGAPGEADIKAGGNTKDGPPGSAVGLTHSDGTEDDTGHGFSKTNRLSIPPKDTESIKVIYAATVGAVIGTAIGTGIGTAAIFILFCTIFDSFSGAR